MSTETRNQGENQKEKMRAYEKLPTKWKNKSSDIYNIDFIMIPFEKKYICRLIAIICDDHLIVNLIVDTDSNDVMKPKSICLPVSEYVVNAGSEIFSQKFKNLKKLSILYKDKLATPTKCSILTNEGIVNPSLLGVPDEVKRSILQWLPTRDIQNVGRTCKTLLLLSKDFTLRRTGCSSDIARQLSLRGKSDELCFIYSSDLQ